MRLCVVRYFVGRQGVVLECGNDDLLSCAVWCGLVWYWLVLLRCFYLVC